MSSTIFPDRLRRPRKPYLPGKTAVAQFLFLFFAVLLHAQTVSVSGYVYDKATGESLIGVTVKDQESGKGGSTNEYGFYSLALSPGNHTLVFSYLGYQTARHQLDLKANQTFNLRLQDAQSTLQTVEVRASNSQPREHVQNTEMGKLHVPIEILKNTPALFGESDIIKALQLMPGVKRGTEGSTGMFVRGGGNDENLVLLDEAPVYNIGHALGFLSVFNSNSIKEVNMYKGAFPAQYGGRLSSIMDVRMREGNDQRLGMAGSIGNIASQLTVEAPIIKEKASFILSGRRSYLDRLVAWLTPAVFPYYFYDLNAKVNYKINERDRVYLSSYFGRDVVAAKSQGDSTDFSGGIDSRLGNFTISSRWNHIYPSNRLFHNLTVIRSAFEYNIEGGAFGNNLLIRSAITDYAVKMDYDYRPNTENLYKFGGAITAHTFRPNLISVQGDISQVLKDRPAKKIQNEEMALYGSWERDFGPEWKVNAGMRLSGSAVEGVFYAGLEPRASVRYALSERHSLKFGYARMKQYLHLVSSSSLALPTDLWYPVTRQVAPGASDQVSAGWFTYFGEKSAVTVSAEAYYKKMHHLVEYREGARLILNDNYEDELVRGDGQAWGLELLAQKNSGRLTGWVGYTLSWANRTFPDLNQGKTYWAKYDRRHDISVVANYDIRPRWAVSAAWVFSTGAPFTPIVAKYLMPFPNYGGIDLLPVYPLRNSYRLHGSRRLDIDMTFKGKKRGRWQGEWHVGAYNFFNRAQPNRVVLTFDETTGKEKYQEKGLFGVIGSLSYNFKF